MSNKNSKSELVLEDIRSNYPDISCVVQDNPTKVAETSKNDNVQQSNAQKVTFIQTKIPSNQSVVGKLNSSANSVQKIPQSVGDRKVPPYVNTLPLDPVRVPKVHPQKMIPKVTQKQVTEKVIVTTESTISSIAFNNKIPSAEFKKSTSIPQIVRSSSQTPIKSVNKQIDKPSTPSTAVASDEMKSNDTNESTNKNTADKVSLMIQSKSPFMSRTTDVFEKNIQSNVLSVTPRPTLSTQSPKTIPSKDKTNSTDSSPKSVTTPSSISKSTPSKPVLTTDSLCKNISKMVSVQCADSSSKPGRIVSANTSPKSDTTVKNITKATNSNEAAAKISNKIYIAVTSTESSNKTEDKNSTVKNVNSRSVSPATTPSTIKSASKSPTTNLSAPSTPKTHADAFAIPSSPSIPNVPSHISNNKNVTLTLTQTSGNLQLSSLSEIENNKDIREALNSGSTASIGENVTISSAGSGYYVIQAASTKVRNVSSETTIETITKQQSSSNAALTRNKNGNSNDSVQSSKSESNSGPSTPSSQSAGESRNTMQEAAFSTSHDLDELEDANPKSSKKKVDEPVECLTISSDEEEAEPDHFVSSLSDTSDVCVSIMSKEPQIGRDDDHGTDGEKYEREVETLLETTSGDGFTNLACRTVRIGSYKVVPQENVTLSKYGLKIVVPPLNKPNESVSLKIPIHDIVKVLAHFGRSLPVIFYYVTNQVGARVRNLLKMTDSRDCYFDPASEEESHRRITLLPEKFTEDDKINIGDLYLQRDVLDELTHNEANQLLVKSAPREVQKGLKQVPPNPVQTIMVFPPPPAKGGISINTEDYSCLAEDVFLNDVIIDFYLKYLFHKRLSDEDRQKTHIFSSFFYKRLTDKTTPVPASLQNSKSGDSAARAAEIRHHRVKTWTKNIDIFSKDYIVIPLNENQHWFLAIICFPGLTGPVRYSDNTPIDVDSSKKDKDENASNADNEASSSSQTMTIGSTTITPLRIENSYTVCDDDDDAENRDEADGADEDVNIYTSSDDSDEDYSESEETETGEIRIKPKSADREPIKQPCILIFDSLAGASRARIIATLREYLHVEYKMKHGGEERDFTKNVVKGACPRVPQQTNYTDCGLYVLQYVESFFENKITDYHIPIKMLRYWFSPHTVSNKRYEIQQLLLQLMNEQNINIRSLHLPELKLSPRHPYYDSEEMEEYGDDDELYDEAHMEHGYGYEELDQIEEHDARARAMLEDDVDESEYIDEDEEIVGEDGKYHYSIYDSADEDSHSEELSDDDIYKDIDINVVEATRRNRRTIYHVRTKSDGDEETIHEEEEEIEEDDHEDDQREQFTNERLVSLNSEDVTISRMPATAKEDGDTQSRRLAELKAARPLKKSHHEISLEKTTEGCTPVKKFRSN